jgi:integral membrane sensor domain MASE1
MPGIDDVGHDPAKAGRIARKNVHKSVLSLLAVASFVVYAVMVLSLHQERVSPFWIEEAGALQAATSHWRYGTPLGLLIGP